MLRTYNAIFSYYFMPIMMLFVIYVSDPSKVKTTNSKNKNLKKLKVKS